MTKSIFYTKDLKFSSWVQNVKVCFCFTFCREYTFVVDQDLDEDEDYMTADQVEEQKLEILTKELAKTTQRQLSIIGTIQDQRNLLLALAAKAGVETREQDTR